MKYNVYLSKDSMLDTTVPATSFATKALNKKKVLEGQLKKAKKSSAPNSLQKVIELTFAIECFNYLFDNNSKKLCTINSLNAVKNYLYDYVINEFIAVADLYFENKEKALNESDFNDGLGQFFIQSENKQNKVKLQYRKFKYGYLDSLASLYKKDFNGFVAKLKEYVNLQVHIVKQDSCDVIIR